MISPTRRAIVSQFTSHFERGIRENINIVDSGSSELPSLSMREVLEAIVVAINHGGGVEIINPPVSGRDDDVLAGIAYASIYEAARAVHAARRMLDSLESNERKFRAVEVELSEKTAALRAVDRETNLARVDARMAEVRAAERTLVTKELEDLRSECARLRSENDELRANKRKLREALERAKERRP